MFNASTSTFSIQFSSILVKHFGVLLYLAKTFNIKNYVRMASRSDNLRNLDFRAESPQTVPHNDNNNL